MKLYPFSYRFADEVLDSPQFRRQKRDIIGILKSVTVPKLATPKKTRSRNTRMAFTTDQKSLNVILDEAFVDRGWELHPLVTEDKKTKIAADFKEGQFAVALLIHSETEQIVCYGVPYENEELFIPLRM